jgi:hypothetical protein
MLCNDVIFARIAQCLKCRRFIGDAKIAYTAPKAIAAAWNGNAHLLMTSHFSGNRKFSPLRFKLSGSVLVPEGMPAQADLNTEVF